MPSGRAKVRSDMLAPFALLALVTIQVIHHEHLESIPPGAGDSGTQVDPTVSAKSPSSSEPSSADVQAKVVAHCEVALGQGECQSASTSRAASARVLFEENRVVVTLLSEPQLPARSLEFSPADTPEQRQVAAGLLVAAMSAAAESDRESRLRMRHEQEDKAREKQLAQEQKAKDVALEESKRAAPSDPLNTERSHLLFDLGATYAPPVDGSENTLGGLLRASWQPSTRNGFFLEFRFAQSLQHAPRLRFGDAALGTSLILTGARAPLHLWLNASAVLNLVEVSQVNSLDESQIAIRGGARVGLGIAPRLLPLSPWLGLDLAGLAPTVEVRAGEDLVDRLPAFVFTTSLGIRWDVSP